MSELADIRVLLALALAKIETYEQRELSLSSRAGRKKTLQKRKRLGKLLASKARNKK